MNGGTQFGFFLSGMNGIAVLVLGGFWFPPNPDSAPPPPPTFGMFVSCHGEGAPAPVVGLPSCGCGGAGARLAHVTFGLLVPFQCGKATAVTTAPLRAPNCVLHVE